MSQRTCRLEQSTSDRYFRASRSFMVVDFGVNRKGLWDFLMINSKHGPIYMTSCTPFLR